MEANKRLLPEKLKQLREMVNLQQRKVAAALDVDTATYSKIENGKCFPNKEQVLQLAEILSSDTTELLIIWMADRIVTIAESDIEIASDAIKLVNETLKSAELS